MLSVESGWGNIATYRHLFEVQYSTFFQGYAQFPPPSIILTVGVIAPVLSSCWALYLSLTIFLCLLIAFPSRQVTDLSHLCVYDSFYNSSFMLLGAQKCIELVKNNNNSRHLEKELLCALVSQGKFLVWNKFLGPSWEVSEEGRLRMNFL